MEAKRKFDTKVQLLRYKVLREVAKNAWYGTLNENLLDIPKTIVPGKKPSMRCCVYKERAILNERVKLALSDAQGGDPVIEVIDIACDECPAAGFEVTDSCRGCLAHHCEHACRKNAISFDRNRVAYIDKEKCVECGQCAKVCPFSAIVNRKRPCLTACKADAIYMDQDNAAAIDYEKCTACGACVYQCPFGAISDRSYLLSVISMLKDASLSDGHPVLAMVAPSLYGQFAPATVEQVISGLKALGFQAVCEAALGADMVAVLESAELKEKGFATSSCCPAFVSYIESAFPMLAGEISSQLSPAATLARALKTEQPEVKIVFIGPCTAKKAEMQKPSVRPYLDAVMTFEELQALFDSRNIDLLSLPGEKLEDASPFGRRFARSSGVAEAVAQGLLESGGGFDFRPCVCDGLPACRDALKKRAAGVLNENFLEGMACVGGCVGGAGVLSHAAQKKNMDAYGAQARYPTLSAAIQAFQDKKQIVQKSSEE